MSLWVIRIFFLLLCTVAGYAVSQQKRKLIEQVFGWMKTVGGLRKLRHRGGELVDWIVTFTAAAYNLIRLRTLLPRVT